MRRIAVAEDELQCRQVLLDHIRRFAGESGISCPVGVYSGKSELLERYKGQYDLLLMDMQMVGWTVWRQQRRSAAGIRGSSSSS